MTALLLSTDLARGLRGAEPAMRAARAREIGESEVGAVRDAGARMHERRLVAVLALETVLLVVAIAAAILARAGAPLWRAGRDGWRTRRSPIPPRPVQAATEREPKAA